MIRKIDLANEALEICGLVSSSNQATPEMTKKALKAIERSIINLEREGVYIGYKKSENMFNPDPNQDSGISDALVDDVIKYVSIDICEALAAPFTSMLQVMQERAADSLMPVEVLPIKRPSNVPSGAGNQRGAYRECDNYLTTPEIEENTDETCITTRHIQ